MKPNPSQLRATCVEPQPSSKAESNLSSLELFPQGKKPTSFPLFSLIAFGVLAILALNAYSPIMQSAKASAKTNHINNAKQIYMALHEFAKDHDGLYPCDATGPAATAEECFNQLLAGGYLDDEEVFWNRGNAVLGSVSPEAPNNDGILTANENCWGYVKGLTSQSRTNLPILFDSSIAAGEFDTSVWEGRAIIAKLNGTVESMKIDYGVGQPFHEDGRGKIGPIPEKRGTRSIDLFKELPEGAKVLPPLLDL